MFKDINPTLGEIVTYLSSYLFAQIQIDVPDWPTGMRVLVVLQNVRLSAQSTASQHKPAPLPGLERVKDLLLKKVFMCKNNRRTRCKHSTPVCQLLRSFWDFYFGLWTSVFFLSELLIICRFFFCPSSVRTTQYCCLPPCPKFYTSVNLNVNARLRPLNC